MHKSNLSDEFENTVNSIDSGVAILVEETRSTIEILKNIESQLDVLVTRGDIKLGVVHKTSEKPVPSGDILADMFFLRDKLRKAKPSDRSELDRHFAIVITDLEKLMAYYSTFILAE